MPVGHVALQADRLCGHPLFDCFVSELTHVTTSVSTVTVAARWGVEASGPFHIAFLHDALVGFALTLDAVLRLTAVNG